MAVSHWIASFRLRTLPLALSSIGMGSFLAAASGKFNMTIFLLCCLTTVLLQVLSNLANDYGDSVHGADHAGRSGPSRSVQTGAISPESMKRAIILFAVFSFISGIVMLYLAFGWNTRLLLTFVALGIVAIAGAILYTVGKKPYGYMGLGDLSVLIFFGFFGVAGSFFLFTMSFDWMTALPAMTCGLFSVGVLNINNIRDIESDRQAGKNSIPVRIGKRNAGYYHWALLTCGWLCGIGYCLWNYKSPYQFLFVVTLPLFFMIGKAVQERPSAELDPYLKRMALSTLLFVVLFGAGQLLT